MEISVWRVVYVLTHIPYPEVVASTLDLVPTQLTKTQVVLKDAVSL